MKLPAYPRSKPSGVEWLGDVPEHWEVKRSDGIVSADRSQLSPEAFADRDVFHYSIPVVQETGTGQVENGESIASAKQVIKKPVVLVSKLNPRKATICLAKPQTILTLCSTEFVALNADKCELTFLEYLTRSELFRQGLDSRVQSVTRSHQRANPADIYRFWNAWPTREDQQSIAAFLDRETGRLDRLVAKKRELIERLKEKRTALISRTVTRGLPPAAARAAGLPANPSLKPSGLDWLDDIPKHWEFKKLRYLCEIATGDKDTVDAVDEGEFPFFVRSQTVERIDSYSFDCEAVLTAGDGVGVGKVFHHHQGKFAVHQRVYVLHNFRKVSGRYLFMFMKEFFARVALGGEAKSTVDSLRRPIFTDFVVLLPPLPEQAAIAAYLDEETAKLDALVGKVEEAVERLQEYRTALITATVTGKVDVRKESHGK